MFFCLFGFFLYPWDFSIAIANAHGQRLAVELSLPAVGLSRSKNRTLRLTREVSAIKRNPFFGKKGPRSQILGFSPEFQYVHFVGNFSVTITCLYLFQKTLTIFGFFFRNYLVFSPEFQCLIQKRLWYISLAIYFSQCFDSFQFYWFFFIRTCFDPRPVLVHHHVLWNESSSWWDIRFLLSQCQHRRLHWTVWCQAAMLGTSLQC